MRGKRYPCKDDFPCNLDRRTAVEKVTHFLRELAVQEMKYFHVVNTQVPTEPDTSCVNYSCCRNFYGVQQGHMKPLDNSNLER